MTNIQTFNMSHYLHLSCTYSGHWLLPCVLLLSLLANLCFWLYCHLEAEAEAELQCMTSTVQRIFQLLICLTLLAYFNVLADLFTQKMKRLVVTVAADTEDGLAQLSKRLWARLVCGDTNSMTPVEEINQTENTGNTQYSAPGDNEQNQNSLKDHIRYRVHSLRFKK